MENLLFVVLLDMRFGVPFVLKLRHRYRPGSVGLANIPVGAPTKNHILYWGSIPFSVLTPVAHL